MENKKYRISKKKLTCSVTDKCESVPLPSPDDVIGIHEQEIKLLEAQERERKNKKIQEERQHIKQKQQEMKQREELQNALVMKLSKEKFEQEMRKKQKEQDEKTQKFQESLVLYTQQGYGFDDSWWSLCK